MQKQLPHKNWQVHFFTIWIGQAFSLVGSAVVRFALIWWLTEETGSAIVLTTANLVAILPMLLLAPFSGALVDRWNRRWVMIIADAAIAIFTAVLALMYWLSVVQIWHVYLILFLRAFGDVFQSPAMQASTSLMVPKSQLARVGGMNDMLMGVVNIIAPPLGALLVAMLSMEGTLTIDLVTAALAIAPLFFIPLPQPTPKATDQPRTSVFQDMGEGVHYVWNWRGLAFMFLALAGLRFFLAPAFSLLPLMVTQHFGGDALELGWMNSANSFGFIIGGVLLGIWGGFKRKTITALVGFIGLGIGSLAFGLVPGSAFGLALVVMFLRSLTIPLIRSSVMAIFQTYVPPEMQGRVFTLLLTSLSLMAPVSLMLAGPLAEAYGVPLLFIVTGVGCLIIAVVWLLNPTILNMETQGEKAIQRG